jgi:hypothetical protein
MPKESIALGGGHRDSPMIVTRMPISRHTLSASAFHVEKPRLISRRASTRVDADVVKSSRLRGIQQVGPHADARRIFKNHHFFAVLRNNRVIC